MKYYTHNQRIHQLKQRHWFSLMNFSNWRLYTAQHLLRFHILLIMMEVSADQTYILNNPTFSWWIQPFNYVSWVFVPVDVDVDVRENIEKKRRSSGCQYISSFLNLILIDNIEIHITPLPNNINMNEKTTSKKRMMKRCQRIDVCGKWQKY